MRFIAFSSGWLLFSTLHGVCSANEESEPLEVAVPQYFLILDSKGKKLRWGLQEPSEHQVGASSEH